MDIVLIPAYKPDEELIKLVQQIYKEGLQILVVDDLKPAWVMCRNAGVSIAFAAWSKQNAPAILEEMTALCDYTFHSPEELEQFIFM